MPETVTGTLAERVAWFHERLARFGGRRPSAEITGRADADQQAWRIYSWWRHGVHAPADVTPAACHAMITAIPELALTGRNAPRGAGGYADVAAGVAEANREWAARLPQLTSDRLHAARRSAQWRAGYELRHVQLAETLCYRPRGGGDVVHRGHCTECQAQTHAAARPGEPWLAMTRRQFGDRTPPAATALFPLPDPYGTATLDEQ